MSPDYEWDVFISYKREKLVQGWLREVVDRLGFFLTQEIGGTPARCFFDVDTLEPGDKWPITLRHGLQRSKCMIGIWMPSYFQSTWCVSEWQSFRAREELLQLHGGGLVIPVSFHDGEHFPSDARAVQFDNWADYGFTLPAFWQTAKAVELEEKLKRFVTKLAKKVSAAPAFRADWPIIDASPDGQPTLRLQRL